MYALAVLLSHKHATWSIALRVLVGREQVEIPMSGRSGTVEQDGGDCIAILLNNGNEIGRKAFATLGHKDSHNDAMQQAQNYVDRYIADGSR